MAEYIVYKGVYTVGIGEYKVYMRFIGVMYKVYMDVFSVYGCM